MAPQTAHSITSDQRQSLAVTKMVMRLFEHWKITYEQQAMLLDLSSRTHSTIANYKHGRAVLPNNRDTQDRVRFLLGVHQQLRKLFPLNLKLVYAWPTTPNQFFTGRTPILVIEQEGFLGLVKVYRYLENYSTS